MDDAKEVDEDIICSLCHELVHKPVVFPCGHFACQWRCFLKLLKPYESSICPTCRSPVTHHHGVCRLFDSLVKTHYPALYSDREKDKEKALGHQNTVEEVAGQESEDLNCVLCKEFVFRPLILCCGCAYCAGCVQIPDDFTFKCVECGILHHNMNPNVCYGLHNFLERHYTEYGKSDRFPGTAYVVTNNGLTCDATASAYSWWTPINLVHIGQKCSCCNTSPLVGDCYQCMSCKSEKGAVICLECYERSPWPPTCRNSGKDSEEHRFVVVPPVSHRGRILKIAAQKSVVGIKPIVHVFGLNDGYEFIYNGRGGSIGEMSYF